MPCSRFVNDQEFQHQQKGFNCIQEICGSNHAVSCKPNLMSILNLTFVSNLFELLPQYEYEKLT